MKASEAFSLAQKIEWHYNRALYHSTGLNTSICENLGPDLYKKFCEEIATRNSCEQPAFYKNFSQKFINNSTNESDGMRDSEVRQNYSLHAIFETLAKITA